MPKEEAVTETLHPRANPDLIGHADAERALLGAWSAGRMPHAWLIAGPRGIGKATVAYRFARFVMAGGAAAGGLFGAAPDSLAVAADDPVFRRIAAGGHADLVTLAPGMIHPETGKETQEIVVAQVRHAIEFLFMTAAEGGWRILVVDEAEAMNRNAANALLKVLEEPPARCLILLVSHSPGRLLPTIRSRCRLLTMRVLEDAQIDALLMRHRPELDAAERRVLAGLAKGSIGRAIELADRGGVELHRELTALLDDLPDLDIPAAHALADQAGRAGDDAAASFRVVLELMDDWIARRLRSTTGSPEPWSEAVERVRRLATATEGLNLDRKQALLAALFAVRRAAAMSAVTA
jgi:DNA polymerase III subunit delta'